MGEGKAGALVQRTEEEGGQGLAPPSGAAPTEVVAVGRTGDGKGGGPVWCAPVGRPRKKGERVRGERKEVSLALNE
jgi:hypothetical protein